MQPRRTFLPVSPVPHGPAHSVAPRGYEGGFAVGFPGKGRDHVFGRLFLLFVLVPLVELAILVRLGTLVGFWPTLALVLTTGALGAVLARQQGLQVIRGIQAELAVGQMPAARLVDGLLVLIGGILLLTPGLLTDVAGLLLLAPFSRRRMKAALQKRLEGMVRSGQVSVTTLIR